MKSVLLFWQKLHYNVYRFHLFISVKIIGLPFDLLLNNKYVVGLYKKRGVENPSALVRRATTRPDVGPVNWKTDGSMILLIGLIVLSLLNFITAIVGHMIWANWSFLIYLIIIGVPSILINYFSLWKEDKYLNYYKQFQKESKKEHLKWALFSLFTIILIILVLIISFMLMINSINR